MVCLLTLTALSRPVSAQIDTWFVSTVTTDAQTPMDDDVRRIMDAGYYDTTANQTFISFTGENMLPYVAAFDHTSRTWGNPISVAMHPSTTDNHDYSHIFQLPDGHVGLTSSDHNTALYFARSENPNSIAGNWSVMEVGSGLDATYPMPMVSQTDGSVSILYRQTKDPTDYRPISIVRSNDNGQTWSAPQAAIDYNNSRTDYLNEIYLGSMTHVSDHPSVTLGEGYMGTWTLAGGGGTTHKHDRFHKNMYYAFYSFSDQNWYGADGTNLGSNIDDNDAELYAKVFDSGQLVGNRDKSEPPDIGYTSKAVLDSDGNPLVAFQNFKTGSIDIGRWDGSQWNVETPATFANTTALRDLTVYDGKVWLMEDDGNGARVVQLDETTGNWETIASFSPETNANANYFINNANPDALILAINDNADGGAVYSVSTTAPPEPDVVTSDLSSVDAIVGRGMANADPNGYYTDSGGGLVGATGSSSSKTREERNTVFGYTLPTLQPGQSVVSATIYFEITAARDHGEINPNLDVYLLNYADPSTTGDALFVNDGDDTDPDAKKVGEVYFEVGTSTETYADDTHDFSLTLTGETLELLKSFYDESGNTLQTEAFFRFNLDGHTVDISSSALNRYILDTASNETWLEIGVVPEPASLTLLGLGGLLIAYRRHRH